MTSPIDEFWGRPQQAGEHPTQPIVPPTAAGDPPPSGLATDVAPPPAAEISVDWQAKYEEQAKRAKIFMVTTVAAAAALVGSLFFSVANAGSQDATTMIPGNGSGQLGQMPGGPMGGGMPGRDGDGGMGTRDFDHHGFGSDSDDSFGQMPDQSGELGQTDPFGSQGQPGLSDDGSGAGIDS